MILPQTSLICSSLIISSWCYLFQREPHPFLDFYSSLSKHLVSGKHKTLYSLCDQSSHHLHSYATCGSLEKLTCSDLWTSFTRQHCSSLYLILDLAVYSNIHTLYLSITPCLFVYPPSTHTHPPYTDISTDRDVLSLLELWKLTSDIHKRQ